MLTVAFPLGPLISLLSNLFEIRIDAFKTLTQMRRPLSKRSKDIGVWLPILDIVSKIGIVSSGAIIAFTSEFIPRLVYRMGAGRGTLKGYVDHTLSVKNISIIENTSHFKQFKSS